MDIWVLPRSLLFHILFLLCFSFSTDSYIEVLDGSRVHPETYEWARKMAVDALEYDESAEDANPAGALEEILENPERLKDLDLDAFAEELERQVGGDSGRPGTKIHPKCPGWEETWTAAVQGNPNTVSTEGSRLSLCATRFFEDFFTSLLRSQKSLTCDHNCEEQEGVRRMSALEFPSIPSFLLSVQPYICFSCGIFIKHFH